MLATASVSQAQSPTVIDTPSTGSASSPSEAGEKVSPSPLRGSPRLDLDSDAMGDPSRGAANAAGSPLEIDGFLFVDEAGNRVVRPQTTWEEFERVVGALSEKNAPQFRYSLDRLSVTGRVLRDRAEFQFEWRVMADATGNGYVDVPLGLPRWHLTRSPEIEGCRDFALLVDSDAGGHVARLSVADETMVTIRMTMVTSLLPRPDPSMSLQLPDVPVVIDADQSALIQHLSADGSSPANNPSDSASGPDDSLATRTEVEILGRGGEIVDSSARRLRVRCSGGDITLRWVTNQAATPSLPLLEIDSETVVRWSDPDTPAIAAVEMTVRNLRGVVSQFDLRLPPGAVLLDIPRLGTSSSDRQLDEAPEIESGDGTVHRLRIPSEERQQRITLAFDVQLPTTGGDASQPIVLGGVDVVGSLRHRGKLSFDVPSDLELRWRSGRWIRVQTSQDEALTRTFAFDRANYELPVWLDDDATPLELRWTFATEILRNQLQSELTIRPSRMPPDGRLFVADSGWEFGEAINVDDNRPMEIFPTEDGLVIQLDPESNAEPPTIRMRGRRNLGVSWGQISIPLPAVRVEPRDDSRSRGTLTLVRIGRTDLIVDEATSTGLTSESSDAPSMRTRADDVRTFAVDDGEEVARLVATVVDQPPRLTLTPRVTSRWSILDDGMSELQTRQVWTIGSATDLEGRLPIRWYGPEPSLAPESAEPNLGPRPLTAANIANPQDKVAMTVMVGSRSAALVADDSPGHYTLISEGLTRGELEIEFFLRQTFDPPSKNQTVGLAVPLLCPDVEDLRLDAAWTYELIAPETARMTSQRRDSPRWSEPRLPDEALGLRLGLRNQTPGELTVLETSLQSDVGARLRHERLIMRVRGGQELVLGMHPRIIREMGVADDGVSDAGFEVRVLATVDSASTEATVDGPTIRVALPPASPITERLVQVDFWFAVDGPGAFGGVNPILRLPAGSGRVRWTVQMPSDQHVLWSRSVMDPLMAWTLDRWRLRRELIDAGDVSLDRTPMDRRNNQNRYAYTGYDLSAFRVQVVSRALIWILVACGVITIYAVVSWTSPRRYPLLVVVAGLLFTGMLILSPDATVIAGQLGLVALTMVAIIMGVQSLLGSAIDGPISVSSERTLTQPADAKDLSYDSGKLVHERPSASVEDDRSRGSAPTELIGREDDRSAAGLRPKSNSETHGLATASRRERQSLSSRIASTHAVNATPAVNSPGVVDRREDPRDKSDAVVPNASGTSISDGSPSDRSDSHTASARPSAK